MCYDCNCNEPTTTFNPKLIKMSILNLPINPWWLCLSLLKAVPKTHPKRHWCSSQTLEAILEIWSILVARIFDQFNRVMLACTYITFLSSCCWCRCCLSSSVFAWVCGVRRTVMIGQIFSWMASQSSSWWCEPLQWSIYKYRLDKGSTVFIHLRNLGWAQQGHYYLRWPLASSGVFPFYVST